MLKFGRWQRLGFSQGLGPSWARLSRNAPATSPNEGANLNHSLGTARPQTTQGGKTHVKGHPAPLSAFALLGKDTPRPGSQGRKLELRRNSGMDAAPQAHPDDRRLSANSDPSSRGRVLLRHAAHSSSHRRTGHFGLALSERSRRACKGSWLVDRERLLHECRLSHDRQHAWTPPRTYRGTTSALPRQLGSPRVASQASDVPAKGQCAHRMAR